MLTLWGNTNRLCDHVSRRDFLQVGALGLGGLSLADVLRQRAAAGTTGCTKSVILIFLAGGPSHIDTYDMKPAAPADVRGELQPIPTNVPGIDLCELLPLQAKIMDKLAIVRDLQFHNELPEDHDPQEVFTGFPPKFRRPPFGSMVSRLRPPQTGQLPPYISLGAHESGMLQRVHPEDAQYLGMAHRPFEPRTADTANLQLGIELNRLQDRVDLSRRFDQMRRDIDRRGNMAGMDEFTRRAVEMLATTSLRDALDLTREPESIRERYGPDRRFKASFESTRIWPGTKFLLARRLVEAGVPVVTLCAGSWDHHGVLSNGPRSGIYERLREELPWFDQAFAALITDLDERGLLDDVAVVAWGEMGRTPRINRQAGRDHWQDAGFALLAGGGLRTGKVIGATDKHGTRPEGTPHSAQNVFATLYRVLGIDTSTTLPDFRGRPQYLLDDRDPIAELV